MAVTESGVEVHPGGVRDELRGRLLSVTTMDRPLRIATAVTFAGLIAAAASIAAREVHAAPVSLGVVDSVQVTLSAPLFAVALVLLSLGLGYLVASVMLAGRVVAGVGSLALTLLIGWVTGVLGIGGMSVPLPGWAQWLTRGLLVAILLATFLVVLIRGRRHGDDACGRRLRLVVVIVACLLFGGYFVVLWSASPSINGLTLFPQTVSLLMTDVAILTTPLLMIAAIDFGEWGRFGVQRLELLPPLRRDRRRSARSSRILTVVVSAVSVILGFAILRGTITDRLWGAVTSLALFGAAIALLLLGGRLLRVSRFEWPRALRFGALFCVCAVVTWVVSTAAGAAVGAFAVPPLPPVTAHGDYTSTASVHSESGTSGFTALVPVGWNVTPDTANRIDKISNLFPNGEKVVLVGFLAPQGTTMTALETGLHAAQLGSVTSDQGWLKTSVRPPTGGSGLIWLRTESGGQVRVFYGVASGPTTKATLPDLEAIIRTVRTGNQPPATLATVLAQNGGLAARDAASQQQDDIFKTVGVGIELGLAVLGLLAFGIFGRRWSATWRTAVLAFAAVAVITLVASVNEIGAALLGPATTWPVLTVGGLLVAAGVIGLLVVGIAARARLRWIDRLLTVAPGLLGAIVALAVINEVYDVALGAASVPAWAAILILAAVGWDIVASGEAITNLSSASLPRSTRVLAYFGYILVLASAMVFYSGQISAATGHPVSEVFFEPESVTQSALFRIGLPVILVLTMLRLASPAGASDRLRESNEVLQV